MTSTEILTMGIVTLAMGITGLREIASGRWPLGMFCVGIPVIAWIAKIFGR